MQSADCLQRRDRVDLCDGNLTFDSAPYFYVLAILCHHYTDLVDRNQTAVLERIESHVRPATEALVIHAWMIDLWDVTNDDSQAWSTTTFRNLIAFVERDRQTLISGANREVSQANLVNKP